VGASRHANNEAAQESSRGGEILSDEGLREETSDVTKIYCFGDTNVFLRFSVATMLWHSYRFDEKGSAYEGNLKYASVTFVPERKILMTGGVYS